MATVDEGAACWPGERHLPDAALPSAKVGVARRLQRLLREGESRLDLFQRYRTAEWQMVIGEAGAPTASAGGTAARRSCRRRDPYPRDGAHGRAGTADDDRAHDHRLCNREHKRVLLCADRPRPSVWPRRRAEEAKTIHRLLGSSRPTAWLSAQRREPARGRPAHRRQGLHARPAADQSTCSRRCRRACTCCLSAMWISCPAWAQGMC